MENSWSCEENMGPNSKILHMMLKMGYESGLGLGKNKQGIVDHLDIPLKLDHFGFGLHESGSKNQKLDCEEVFVQEPVQWFTSNSVLNFTFDEMKSWKTLGPKKLEVNDETHFCEPEVLEQILTAKAKLGDFSELELMRARSRSNPFEALRSAFFMNRAALKMANIDAATGFMFTGVDRNPELRKTLGPYYFADVCAGPGGFSEYVLWRKGWNFKGFGLTLKADNDFKVADSHCASGACFHALYGCNGDGDIRSPENIRDFAQKVLYETEQQGVHFMMSDGGFSVEGNENLQEVLSKQLYICQCLVALEIVRESGHFVTKLFDIFTPFSVGLIFLMRHCFEKFAIMKPNSSRPANSERYLVCHTLRKTPQTAEIRNYFRSLVQHFWDLCQTESNDLDIVEIVPLDALNRDREFAEYVTNINKSLGAKQIVNLTKLIKCCENPSLADPRQEELRKSCLKYWRIPDRTRSAPRYQNVKDLLSATLNNDDFMLAKPRLATTIEEVRSYVTDLSDWHYVPMSCGKPPNASSHFYAVLGGSRVVRLLKRKWKTVKNLNLIAGSLLYGEMVKEYSLNDDLKKVETKSFHIIDALRLGDVSLADLPYSERLSLIRTYCASVNFETKENGTRIRSKCSEPLQCFSENCAITFNERELKYFAQLRNPCTNKLKDHFAVNSVLLLKTDESQSFKTSYVLRVQINVSEAQKADTESCVNLGDLLYHFKNKS